VIPKTIFLAIPLLAPLSTESKAAGFDCAKASSRAERIICSDKKLLELDEKLTATYRKVYSTASDKRGLKAEQVEWLKERDACETSECIGGKYQNRIDSLERAKQDFSWLKEYTGKTTNALVWDKRFGTFIKSISPMTKQDYGLGEQNLAGALSDALGGPPDKVTIGDKRYITFSACIFRFCPEKGFVWVDLFESTAVAAIIHYDSRKDKFEDNPVLLVFSKNVAVSAVPQRFKADLDQWLTQSDTNNKIERVFIDATGKSTKF